MQGMGIIHHMELGWLVDPAAGVVRRWTPAQPTVAFEARPRRRRMLPRPDRPPRVGDRPAARRDAARRAPRPHRRRARLLAPPHARPLHGCGRPRGLARQPPPDEGTHRGAAAARLSPRHRLRRARARIGRAGVSLVVGVRQSDLDWNACDAQALAPERFALHHELVARADVDLWPGSLVSITGGERRRTADEFATAAWTSRDALLAPLAGTPLARGAAGEIMRRLGDTEAATPGAMRSSCYRRRSSSVAPRTRTRGTRRCARRRGIPA
jgi:hypothetical protein